MNKEFVWDDATIKKLLHAATGNIKDFVMNEDGFLADFKASHTEVKKEWTILEWDASNVTRDSLRAGTCGDLSHDGMIGRGYKIKSVRRLLDNVVFSVGDNCFHGPIVRFNLRNNQITADFEHGDVGCSKLLSELSKPIQRTPLFKDFNGNQVYVGDDFFIVAGDDWRIHNHTSNQSDIGFWKGATTFNSRESAEQYVLMNKPCLSVNDVIKAFEDWKHENEFFEDYLKEFAKQKLNKQ